MENIQPSAIKSSTFQKILFPAIFLFIAILPAFIFFAQRQQVPLFSNVPFATLSKNIFPLFGLYALFFVWVQVILGSGMPLWRKLFPNILRFHRVEGVFALCFAIAHPLLLFIALGTSSFLFTQYIPANQSFFVFLGYVGLVCMFTTVGSAVLMRKAWFVRRWRKIHYANYALFVVAWAHSWFIGSDVRTTSLRYLWIFYAATAIIFVVLRVTRAMRAKQASEPLDL